MTNKTAAVRYASKDTGNELRIVLQAEPEERLVVLADISVHARVKSAAVFLQRRRTGP